MVRIALSFLFLSKAIISSNCMEGVTGDFIRYIPLALGHFNLIGDNQYVSENPPQSNTKIDDQMQLNDIVSGCTESITSSIACKVGCPLSVNSPHNTVSATCCGTKSISSEASATVAADFASEDIKLTVFKRIFSIDLGSFKSFFVANYNSPVNLTIPLENAEDRELFEYLKPFALKFFKSGFKFYRSELLFWRHFFIFVLNERKIILNSILNLIGFSPSATCCKPRVDTFLEFEGCFYNGILNLFNKSNSGTIIPQYFYSFENVSFLIVLLAVIRYTDNCQPPSKQDIPCQVKKSSCLNSNSPPIPDPIVDLKYNALPVEDVKQIVRFSLITNFDVLIKEVEEALRASNNLNWINVEFLSFYWFHLKDLELRGYVLRRPSKTFLLSLLKSAFKQYGYSFSRFLDRLGFTYKPHKGIGSGNFAGFVKFGVYSIFNVSMTATKLHPNDPLKCLELMARGNRQFATTSGHLFVLVLFREVIKRDILELMVNSSSRTYKVPTLYDNEKSPKAVIRIKMEIK